MIVRSLSDLFNSITLKMHNQNGTTDLSAIALDTLLKALTLDTPLNPIFPITIRSIFSLSANSIIVFEIESP